MTDFERSWEGCEVLASGGTEKVCIDSLLIGTKGVLLGSNPGAILRKASRFRRSFSSSRDLRCASRLAACDARVDRREVSRVRTCGSKVNG